LKTNLNRSVGFSRGEGGRKTLHCENSAFLLPEP